MELRIHPLAVIGTFLWRLTIAGFAFWGWWLYGHSVAKEDMLFLTQSGNLLAAIVYAVVAVVGLIALATRREPRTEIPRGAMTLLLVVVASTYIGVIEGDTSEAKDLLTHVVTPALALADWCLVGRSQNLIRWWMPALWLVLPSLYLVVYTANGEALYDFMDPDSGEYAGVLVGLVVATTLGALLLYAIGKVKGAISKSIRGDQGPPPGQRPPYQQQWQQPGPPQPQPQYGAPQGWQQPQPPRQWAPAPPQHPQGPPQQAPWPGPPR